MGKALRCLLSSILVFSKASCDLRDSRLIKSRLRRLSYLRLPKNETQPNPRKLLSRQILHPSEQHSTWNYQWRGEETGEGGVEEGEEPYKIKFREPRGTRNEGIFGAGLIGDCAFTGTRTMKKRNENVEDPSEQWHDGNENSYGGHWR